MKFLRVVLYLTIISVTVVIIVSHKLFFGSSSSSTLFLLEKNFSTNNSLTARNFPVWQHKNSTSMNYLLLQEARQSAEFKEMVNISLDYNITTRGEFQRSKIKEFCSRHNLSNIATGIDLKHLLYDDSRRLVYCYVPKNGCSNFKWMLLRLNGVVQMNQTRPAEDILKNQVHSLSELNETEVYYRLQHYYKMVTVRNPMLRLLSAYRNKIELPFDYENRHHFPDIFKLKMLESYQKEAFHSWSKAGNFSVDIHPSFSAYVRYMSDHPLKEYNEHFKPIMELCSPCALRYDFYANFKVLDYDIYAVIDYLGISEKYYPRNIAHPAKSTAEYVESYYGTLNGYEKSRLFKQFEQELEFYYSLYPEDKDHHKKL